MLIFSVIGSMWKWILCFSLIFIFLLSSCWAQVHPRNFNAEISQANVDQSPIITYKENFFNGHSYFANGQRIKAKQVGKYLEVSPEDAKSFSVANKKLVSGATMRWGAIALGVGANVYLLTTESSNSILPFLGMLGGAIVLDTVGLPMRRDGKRRSSNALESYNYKVSRNLVYSPKVELKLNPVYSSLAIKF
jgi:hypothetical protein